MTREDAFATCVAIWGSAILAGLFFFWFLY